MYPNAQPPEIRRHLGTMGITGNLQLQPIYSLSGKYLLYFNSFFLSFNSFSPSVGGQKSRVAFANVTWKKPHLLLLDEASNHLDIDTVDALIDALNAYDGGVVIVSHDAHLISAVCEQIWVVSNQKVTPFEGDFEDYRVKTLKTSKLSVITQ
jgi:ATP-binding cassette subfamily F protein 3